MNRYLVLIAVSSLAASPAVIAQDDCADAVQGKIAWNRKGATRWNPANVERLCKGAESSTAPARCFERVMQGDIDRSDGQSWGWGEVIELCQGTFDATARVDCYEKRFRADGDTAAAIRSCRNAASTPSRLAHKERKVSRPDFNDTVVADPQLSGQVLQAPATDDQDDDVVISPELGSEAMRKAIAQQAAENERGRERERPRCAQVSLIRGDIELERARVGGRVLRLDGCLGQPDPDDVQVWVRAGKRIDKRRARFNRTSARLRDVALAGESGAQATLVRTRGDETYQLVPWVDIERVDADRDGDGHLAARWGGDDCDDRAATRFPGNAEVPDDDDVDEDCDPTSYGKVDDDRDGFYSDEYCNRANDGSWNCGTDCNDQLSNVNPRHGETPGDGLDNDCDGEVDG
ncbi:MAG: putative metal-binding motif-containing protein [Woeseiaceae bacterium]|nr:putative metal-binding motif-containing protein [Woeseiaceae bacterium]